MADIMLLITKAQRASLAARGLTEAQIEAHIADANKQARTVQHLLVPDPTAGLQTLLAKRDERTEAKAAAAAAERAEAAANRAKGIKANRDGLMQAIAEARAEREKNPPKSIMIEVKHRTYNPVTGCWTEEC